MGLIPKDQNPLRNEAVFKEALLTGGRPCVKVFQGIRNQHGIIQTDHQTS